MNTKKIVEEECYVFIGDGCAEWVVELGMKIAEKVKRETIKDCIKLTMVGKAGRTGITLTNEVLLKNQGVIEERIRLRGKMRELLGEEK